MHFCHQFPLIVRFSSVCYVLLLILCLDYVIEVEYPVIPTTLDSNEWLVVFDGPPVFNTFPDHASISRAETIALSCTQGMSLLV